MDPFVTGSLISAGSSLLGGMFGGGGGTSRKKLVSLQEMMNEVSRTNARMMPAHIVRGAERAGIHPLVLFGSPAMAGNANLVGGNISEDQNNWGTAFMNMGQDISRAYQARQSQQEREADRENAIRIAEMQQKTQLHKTAAEATHADLQNDYLRLQIKRLEQQTTPPHPTGAKSPVITPVDLTHDIKQSDNMTNKFEIIPAPITSADRQVQSLTAGPASPAFKRYRVGGPNFGYYLEVPEGDSFSEGLESLGAIPSMGHTLAHQTLRAVDDWWNGDPKMKPKHKLPEGYYWNWHPIRKVWRAERRN